VREFNRRIAEDPRLASIVLPVREGVSVSVVLPSRP
jgi:predicted O-methyltransferase YrrM